MKSREHLSKSTVSATYYCRPCRRVTPHRIDDGRKGPCLVCNPSAAVTAPPPRKKLELPTELLMMCTCNWGWETRPYPHYHSAAYARAFSAQLKVNGAPTIELE